MFKDGVLAQSKKSPNVTVKVGTEKYWHTKYNELRAELTTLRNEKIGGYFRQEDVRRILNRALRANGLKPISVPRSISKTQFVSQVTNHLWEVLNVQSSHKLSQLQGNGEGQEGEQSW